MTIVNRSPYPADKIQVIKMVKERTGCGLKEAKDAVEEAMTVAPLGSEAHFQKAMELARSMIQAAPSTNGAPLADLSRRVGEVHAQTGCGLDAARKALERTGGNVAQAVATARLTMFQTQPTLTTCGWMWGTCPTCKRARRLINVIVIAPGGAGAGGHTATCLRCLRKILEHLPLITAFLHKDA